MLNTIKDLGWRRAAILSTTVLVGMVGAVILAGPASAHDTSVNGPTTVCDAATGTYTITYTGQGDYDLPSTVSVVDASPAGTTVTPQSQDVQPVTLKGGGYSDPFTIVQTGVPGTATTASITITEVWSDQYTVRGTATATNLGGDCTKTTTPTAPSFANDACEGYAPVGASYTITAVTGVVYKVNGETVAAGTYPATDGSTITITAVAAPGYTLSGTTTFTHTFTAQPTCTTSVVVGDPTFTDDVCHNLAPAGASYTIAAVTGVIYKVNGETVAAGTYPATDGSTITITAVAAPGYTLSGTTTFTHTFAAKPTCTTSAVASTPGFTNDACHNSAPTGASYTVVAATGVVYKLNGATVAAGTYPATDGSTITITAQAAAGYTLTGATSFTHTFTAQPTCTTPSTPLAFTGTSTSVPLTVGVGAALLAVGSIMLIGAGRLGRRTN
jgi:hypothetical protein